jgi:CRISPR-associated endoribonuclease Cas6
MSKCVFRLTFTFRPANDVIIPPFSAKASRLIMYRLSEHYAKLAETKAPFKPLSITPILYKGRPLLKLGDYDNPLYLRAGEQYSFRASLVAEDNLPLEKLVKLESSVVEGFFHTSLILDAVSFECKSLESMGAMDPKLVRVETISPLLLQLPSYGRFIKGRHFLFPVPSLMVKSLLDHWNAHCDASQVITSSLHLPLSSNYTLMEVDYNLRPVTVYYDKLRRPRGIMGWIVYQVRRKRKGRTYRELMKLLEYARYIGVGRSRATGFGQVLVSFDSDGYEQT